MPARAAAGILARMLSLPTECRRSDDGLLLSFNDGTGLKISSETLRRHCPCAECREKRGEGSHDAPLTGKRKPSALRIVEAALDQELLLKEIWAVGNYALGMRWGDGHDSGIYTFDYLRSLADAPLSENGDT